MLINLLPTEEKKYLRAKRRSEMSFVAALIFSAVIIVGALMFLPALIQLKIGIIDPGKISSGLQTTSNTASSTATYESLAKDIIKANNEITLVKSGESNTTISKPSQIIARLVVSLVKARVTVPGSLTIGNWQITKAVGDGAVIPTHYFVSLQGLAENRYVLRSLQYEFTQTEGVIAVEAPVSNYIPGKNISFTMSVAIK